MKKMYRVAGNELHFDRKWKQVEADENSFTNIDIYPIRHVEEALKFTPRSGLVLENGCGLGRVLKHCFYSKRKIIGLEYNEYALAELKKAHPQIPLVRGDALHLPFKDATFDAVLAFGLYPSIEDEPYQAVLETSRVMKTEGIICASTRAQNFMYYLHAWKQWAKNREAKSTAFFKWVFKKDEWIHLFTKNHFNVLSAQPEYYYPPLFRLSIFRDKPRQEISLSKARSSGYPLNKWGEFIDSFLRKYFGKFYDWTLCDLIVVIAKLK